MSSFSRSKKFIGSIIKHTLNSSDDESAARTRPFSFEDIMLRRKNKRSAADVEGGTREARNLFGREGVVKDITDHRETEGHFRHNKNSSLSVQNLTLEESTKISSRWKKEETLSDNVVVRRSNRSSNHDSGLKLMAKLKYDTNGKSKGKKNYHGNLEKRGKNDWRSRNDIDNESGKRHLRDTAGKDVCEDRGRGKFDRENKRKYENGEDDNNRGRNSSKKHDHSKHHDLNKRERKESKVSSSSHHEEFRLDRRRKRSQEHKHRRSASLSPRAHRYSTKLERQKEFLLDSQVKKSGRWHSDSDGTGDATNNSSSQYKRHSGSTSGLGGYSPRKRRTESAIKTPPPVRSPEKKSAGWDLLPTAKAGLLSGSVPFSFQPSNHITSSCISDLPTGASLSTATRESIPGVSSKNLATKTNTSFDLIQLTQATRPMRRLYIENLPHSASEKAIIDCLNGFLMSSGVNHVEGTQPCISCIIHKDKAQALVEFLTPEDASAALSFDGSNFSGAILKIRRPKDFVEIVTGDLDKSVTAVNTVNDDVFDSPNKIFIAGISNAISSNMLRDIVTAFGPLKAYHFGINRDLNEPCAFLEYVDQSIMPKACAGLNGMKIGGRVLKVFAADPFASSLEHDGCQPCYHIPEYVKPLLQQPTVVIKLNNVFNPEVLSTLSEPDIDEILEDIRFECARFGTVKSMNLVKICRTSCLDTKEEYKNIDSVQIIDEAKEITTLQMSKDIENLEDDIINVDNRPDDGRHPSEVIEDKSCQMGNNDAMAFKDPDCKNTLDQIPQELPEQPSVPADKSECQDIKVAELIKTDGNGLDKISVPRDDLVTADTKSEKQEMDTMVRLDLDSLGKTKEKDPDDDGESVFTLGSVFVEYSRIEASSTAAHTLHGRIYDGQEVRIEYVAPDLYRKKFPK